MKIILIALGSLLLLPLVSIAEQTVFAHKTKHPPVIDGSQEDPTWAEAKEVITWDPIAEIEITLKAVYTADEIFFLVKFPDSSENRSHKLLQWDKGMEIYIPGPDREDSMVIKWSMEFIPIDLSISGDDPYKADIWYWKAYRTDHSGYADDKHQIYSDISLPKGQRLFSKNGNTFYLLRKGDQGQAAYKGSTPIGYQKDKLPGFILRNPSGSRADVHAKGQWNNGFWSVEFSRKLVTGHDDDIALDVTQKYRFGVSRYEIAGRKTDPDIEIPKFGSGEISEHLVLQFK